MTNDPGYGRKAFKSARHHLYDLLNGPVQAWMAAPPARRTDTAYRKVTEIPMELANAGFGVTMARSDAGWSIEVEKEITDRATIRIHGQAQSFASALFQISTQVDTSIGDLERRARKAWEAGEPLEQEAA